MINNQKRYALSVTDIKTWKKFARKVRSGGCHLFRRLDDFPRSVLVTGCQRSGTTMLSRIITQSQGMVNFQFGRDDELDAALILCGYVEHKPRGRYCFQTTYLNECYQEYFHCDEGHKIIWVIRNPYSVIYSMLYHWKRFALNELFKGCGVSFLNDRQRHLYERFGILSISRAKRACMSYMGKTTQLLKLHEKLGADRVMVVDYDELVANKNQILPAIYKFIDLPYSESYGDMMHEKSLNKAQRLSAREQEMIEEFCMPIYKKARDSFVCS